MPSVSLNPQYTLNKYVWRGRIERKEEKKKKKQRRKDKNKAGRWRKRDGHKNDLDDTVNR